MRILTRCVVDMILMPHISNLWYACDTTLKANSEEEFVQLTNSVNEVGTGMSLRLGVKKTKLLVAGSDQDEVHTTDIDGEKVDQVDHFKYLGSTKYYNANCSRDIRSMIAIAKKRMIDLQVLWNDRNLSMPLKMKLVKTLVWSVIVYGVDTLGTLQADESRIMP